MQIPDASLIPTFELLQRSLSIGMNEDELLCEPETYEPETGLPEKLPLNITSRCVREMAPPNRSM
jgi:hypothetical protein